MVYEVEVVLQAVLGPCSSQWWSSPPLQQYRMPEGMEADVGSILSHLERSSGPSPHCVLA